MKFEVAGIPQRFDSPQDIQIRVRCGLQGMRTRCASTSRTLNSRYQGEPGLMSIAPSGRSGSG